MREVIEVARNECLLDVLSEMGERIRSAWIFVDDTVIENLKQTADGYSKGLCWFTFSWRATDECPKRTFMVNHSSMFSRLWSTGGVKEEGRWYFVAVDAEGIAFAEMSTDPIEVLFFTMSEVANPLVEAN